MGLVTPASGADLVRILAAMKEEWGDRLATVLLRRGHYAHDSKNVAAYPHADMTSEHIGDLVGYDLPAFISRCNVRRTE